MFPHPQLDHGACAGPHRSRTRGHRRPADRCAAQARHHAERSGAASSSRRDLRRRGSDPNVVEALTRHRKPAQRRRPRRRQRRCPPCLQLHLRTGLPDADGRGLHHRRRPPRGAGRRGQADRARAAKRERELDVLESVGRGDPPSRWARRTGARARRKFCSRWRPRYGFDISVPRAALPRASNLAGPRRISPPSRNRTARRDVAGAVNLLRFLDVDSARTWPCGVPTEDQAQADHR